MSRRRDGPSSRGEIERVALALLRQHGAQILATARRYSSTAEDAEDAYQRGFEILLTKAPTRREEELVPWLKTVVKHEAFAIRRQRERAAPITDDGELQETQAADAATDEHAERYERLRLGAEALRRLKPQEIRCLVLKAEGLSYKEICEATGFSYTKVNRCLTEGRRAFVQRLDGIEGGAECERLGPLLSGLADGEATAEELRKLRPHLKSCLNCRARLRAFRAAPTRVAALVPPAAVAASAGGATGPLRGWLESLLGAAQERAGAWGERAHTVSELATGQKLAAVAASGAALAGGGATVDRLASHNGPPKPDRPAEVRSVEQKPVEPHQPHAPDPAPTGASTQAPTTPTPAEASEPPAPDPAAEFAPGAAPAPTPAAPRGGEFAAGGGAGGGRSGAASGEFTP